MKNNRKFIESVFTASSFLFLIKIIFAGIFQAFVAFFTKKKLEDWDKKN